MKSSRTQQKRIALSSRRGRKSRKVILRAGHGPAVKEDAHPSPELRKPSVILPILLGKEAVIFPFMIAPLCVSDKASIQLVDDVLSLDSKVTGYVTLKPKESDDAPDEPFTVGTCTEILKMLKFPDGSVRLLVQGTRRFRILEMVQSEPYYRAKVEYLEDEVETGTHMEALFRNVSGLFIQVIKLVPYLPDELQVAVVNITDPGKLTYLIAAHLNIELVEKQSLLEIDSVRKRLEALLAHLNRELEILELGSKIQAKVQSEIGKGQREHLLREHMKAIQHELGEGDERTAEVQQLREKVEKASLPEEALKAANEELGRIVRMPSGSAEYTVSRTYVDWLISLPWSIHTEDAIDIPNARTILDEDHYDLEKVKERIIEYLAVLKLRKDMKGPILCFQGPPGVGKTSLGRSIARAIGRKFIRLSLGGVRDEAEIRGHRRTYVGALPGRIIQSIKKGGSNNPLFMLDEIDKLGADYRGDPAAALLEVLDPEQNFSFVDHYLDVPFDLSHVMFITTANVLDTVPPALQDRMETIELPGYSEEEKVSIAVRHLIPKQVKEHGLKPDQVTFKEEAIAEIIGEYTREAGLRNLEREIASLCRKVATKVAVDDTFKMTIGATEAEAMLGPPKAFPEVAETKSEPGVATGLAWTRAGGDIIFIESTKMPGKETLMLTGQLGDVMKESAQAALSYVRANVSALGIAPDIFSKQDIHLHVPAGAIPKDGPSAGVAILVSLVSLFTGRPVRPDVAMTGEITLRGRVLPVGGIKEKMLAARRAGIKTVLLPAKNEKDLQELPQHVRDEMTFHFIDMVADLFKYVF